MTQILAVAKHSPCAHGLPCSLRLGGVTRVHRLCSRYICPWSVESCLPKGIRIIRVSPAQLKGQNTHIAEQRSLLSTSLDTSAGIGVETREVGAARRESNHFL